MTLANPFRKQVLTLLGEHYSDKTLVLCPTVFVRLLNGDHKAAILLSQILFWTDRTKDAAGWFYKRYEDWQRETGLSETQVRRIVNGDPRVQKQQITLRELGVETKLKKVKHIGAPVLHYRIDQARFLTRLQAFIEQGDSQHCQPLIPANEANECPPLTGMNTAGSAPSLIPSEITNKEEKKEDHDPNNVDPDDDFQIFSRYRTRFGKLKPEQQEVLNAELERLGASRVGLVLERCSTRGRSWRYVQRALANETAAEVAPQTLANERYGGLLTFSGSEALNIPAMSAEALQPVASDRVHTVWNPEGVTVLEAWSAAFQQLELQFDRATFVNYIRDAVLVDYDPATMTFVILTSSTSAREMLNHRLARTVRRILGDILQHEVKLEFVVSEDWAGEPTSATRSA